MTNQTLKQPAEMNRAEFVEYVGPFVGVIRTNNTIFFKFKDARNLGEFHAKVGFLDFCKRQNIPYEDIKPVEISKCLSDLERLTQ